MNIEQILEYLDREEEHYRLLSKFMRTKDKQRYADEHAGKVKFIQLLRYWIKGEVDG